MENYRACCFFDALRVRIEPTRRGVLLRGRRTLLYRNFTWHVMIRVLATNTGCLLGQAIHIIWKLCEDFVFVHFLRLQKLYLGFGNELGIRVFVSEVLPAAGGPLLGWPQSRDAGWATSRTRVAHTSRTNPF